MVESNTVFKVDNYLFCQPVALGPGGLAHVADDAIWNRTNRSDIQLGLTSLENHESSQLLHPLAPRLRMTISSDHAAYEDISFLDLYAMQQSAQFSDTPYVMIAKYPHFGMKYLHWNGRDNSVMIYRFQIKIYNQESFIRLISALESNSCRVQQPMLDETIAALPPSQVSQTSNLTTSKGTSEFNRICDSELNLQSSQSSQSSVQNDDDSPRKFLEQQIKKLYTDPEFWKQVNLVDEIWRNLTDGI